MSGAVYLSGFPEQPIAHQGALGRFRHRLPVGLRHDGGALRARQDRNGQKVEGALLRTAVAFANSLLIEQALTQVNRVATVNRGFNSAPADILPHQGWLDRRDGDRPADVPALVPHGRRGALSRRPALRRRPVARRSRRGHFGADERVVRRAELRGGARRTRKGQHRRRPGLFARSRRSTTRISAPRTCSRSATIPGWPQTVPLAPTPIELSETPGTYRRPAPLLGEHTDQILGTLGYTADEIAALRAEGVV